MDELVRYALKRDSLERQLYEQLVYFKKTRELNWEQIVVAVARLLAFLVEHAPPEG
jgi:hypothetical protein